MLNFLRKRIPPEDQKVFDMSFTPFFWYTITITIFIIIAELGIANWNSDTSFGLFISWFICSFSYIIAIGTNIGEK